MSTAYQAEYELLLIRQYWDRTKARAEIAARMAAWEKVKDLLDDVPEAFDLDTATGVQLDLLGRVVGYARPTVGTSDADYRFLLRAAVARNTGVAVMIGDGRPSLQDAVQFLFPGDGDGGDEAWLLDGLAMNLILYVPADTAAGTIAAARALLPRPQGVALGVVLSALDGMFGFEDNTHCVGFADKFDPSEVGGPFAERVVG